MKKTKQIKAGLASALLGVLSPMAMIVPASAANIVWEGDVSPAFSISGNWAGGVVPSNLDSAVFPATSSFDAGSATIRSVSNNLTGLELINIVFNGEVELSSTSFQITGNDIGISGGILAEMTGNGGDHSVETNVDLLDDVTFSTEGANTLSVGTEDSTLTLGENTLTLDASGGTISILGTIDGDDGAIELTGDGKVNMMAGGFAGTTTVSSGEFVVNETTEGDVIVDGGILKGESDVLGTLTMLSGDISAGMSPGCLGTSDLTFRGGSYNIELAGTEVCTEYDSTTVVGGVDLGDATTLNVDLIDGFEPEVNDSFAIITNDEDDNVEGTFEGLDDGDRFTQGDYTYQINYDAGDGNDVVLLVTGTPEAPDTGVGSILTSPIATLVAAILVASSLVGYRVYELKKVRK